MVWTMYNERNGGRAGGPGSSHGVPEAPPQNMGRGKFQLTHTGVVGWPWSLEHHTKHSFGHCSMLVPQNPAVGSIFNWQLLVKRLVGSKRPPHENELPLEVIERDRKGMKGYWTRRYRPTWPRSYVRACIYIYIMFVLFNVYIYILTYVI